VTDKLIAFRHKQNKSIVEFAKELNMGYDSYYKIESCKRKPNYQFLKKFKKAYPEADIDEIFFNDSLDKLSNY
jgi:DNA-binding XRE family transcriptional regulator